MLDLRTYILETKSEHGSHKTLKQSSTEGSYQDQGIEVVRKETTFHFTDGAVIKYCVESDSERSGDDQICTECWITYEVIAEPGEEQIHPKIKTFTNHCQESFWLKMRQQQDTAAHC